jgi:GcrA cell cycle regulator
MASIWTPELKAKVARLWEKHSDSVISRILWEEDRVSFSRNAIIGLRHRMGATGGLPPQEKEVLTPRPRRNSGPIVQKINRARASVLPNRPPNIPVELARIRCVEIVPRHLTLLDLEPDDCRYPYGGDKEGEAITFCAHPKMPGSPYCVPHFHLTRGPGTISERAATRGIAA